ncbi:MAG: hypothetical protein II478_02525 [Bacteroidales bacterium]|nr:hypothetical protein [Bacteroidales bacterium]
MLKFKHVIIFFAAILPSFALRAQETTAAQKVTSMYDRQAQILYNLKTEQQYLRNPGFSASLPNAVYADLKVNGVAAKDFIASRNLALGALRHSKDASERDIAAFFDSRDVPVADELPLFNDYIRAKFAEKTGATTAERIDLEYGLSPLATAQMPKKVKVTSDTPEPVTGGRMWMFANGIRVIYRQDKKARDFSYTLALRGGFGSIEGLQFGQGAYVGDLLPLYRVRGMSGVAFRNMLAYNGITIDAKVSLTDLQISGSAPSDGLEMLLQALLAITNNSSVDPDAYAYCRTLPGKASADAVIDSLLRPDFLYTPYKYEVSLPQDLMARALGEYYAQRFANVDDGILIITGNKTDYQMQTILGKYLGAFRTSKKYNIYPQVQYMQRAGTTSYTASGSPQLKYAMSIFLSLSAESYLVTRLAEIILQTEVRKAFRDNKVTLQSTMETLPYERYCVTITVDGVGSSQAMQTLRGVIAGCSELEISPDELKAYKAQLLGIIGEELTSDRIKSEIAIARYCGRKDLLSNYQARVDKIDAEQLADILEAIVSGSTVEYVQR